jgi:small subunit ribosomal protein S14
LWQIAGPMATQGKIAMNLKRQKLSAKYAAKRAALKEIIRNPKTSGEEREAAMRKLQALPRNSNPNRIRNRCFLTGRPRAYYRKFGLSRIALRRLGLEGEIPGLTKSSW